MLAMIFTAAPQRSISMPKDMFEVCAVGETARSLSP
jgi:hypothetical protein